MNIFRKYISSQVCHLQDACEDKLDVKQFPIFGGGAVRPNMAGRGGGQLNARYGQWHKDKAQQQRNGPRLIFIVLGGISYSEMRSAYEVANQYKNCEVMVGGTHLLTPEAFLGDLEKLSIIPGQE